MGGLKTFLCAIAICGTPAWASAFTSDRDELVTYFARCTGQLSALMEFQWLTSDPAADQTEFYRAQMIDLLDAVRPEGDGHLVLSLRINAKLAFSALLQRGHFGQDSADIEWVETRVSREIANCRGLLLN